MSLIDLQLLIMFYRNAYREDPSLVNELLYRRSQKQLQKAKEILNLK